MNCGFCGRTLILNRSQCAHCGHYVPQTTGAGGIAKEDDFVDALDVKSEEVTKIITGEWWDEAWGGTKPGFYPSEAVLVAGAPGMGKSTLLILIGFAFAKVTGKTTYYISAEQDKAEWKTYVDRLNLPIERGMFRVLNVMGSGGQIDEAVFKAFPPGLLILDSVTALCGKDRDAQVTVCDNYKKNYSVKYKCPSLIISHINKEGDLAGLMTMQHNVDGICSLFPNERETSKYAGQPVFEFHKHRFGPCHKTYQLIMAENGLFRAPEKKKLHVGGDELLKEIQAEGGPSTPVNVAKARAGEGAKHADADEVDSENEDDLTDEEMDALDEEDAADDVDGGQEEGGDEEDLDDENEGQDVERQARGGGRARLQKAQGRDRARGSARLDDLDDHGEDRGAKSRNSKVRIKEKFSGPFADAFEATVEVEDRVKRKRDTDVRLRRAIPRPPPLPLDAKPYKPTAAERAAAIRAKKKIASSKSDTGDRRERSRSSKRETKRSGDRAVKKRETGVRGSGKSRPVKTRGSQKRKQRRSRAVNA